MYVDVDIDLTALEAGILKYEQLLKSAGVHLERKEYNLAIQDLTRIIELVTKLSPMFSAKGEGMLFELARVYKEPYMDILKSTYKSRYYLYRGIGEKAKSDADLAMCRKLGVDISVQNTPSQNVPSYSSTTTTEKKFPSDASKKEWIHHLMSVLGKIKDKKKFPPNASVKEYQELADEAIASGNYEAAISYCDKVLKRDPRNWITMLSKALAIGFLATPENSRGTLAGDNEDSFLFKSFMWFQKAQTTYLENANKMISSGEEPGSDFITWSQAVYQTSLSMVAYNFEGKIPENSSTQEKFLSHSELIPLYTVMLSFDPNDEDDMVRKTLRDSAQNFRNKFRTFFESYTDANDLIDKYLPEVGVWLHALNLAEIILKSFNPNYNSILVRIKNNKLIELDADLTTKFDDHKSLISSNSSQGSGCLGVILCVIIVAYSLIV